MTSEEARIRVDKWLWAARFFKTRSLASAAVNGGKVHLGGNRVKASRPVGVGMVLTITRGVVEFEVTILALNQQRRPAVEAQLLYEESEASRIKREENRELRRALNVSHSPPAKKPSKRDRRKIKEFVRKS
ncbi:RNA-binding S4 domain-containing protein [Desulfotalea psychrophila]|uniref:Probable heat shock protein Hsp15 n=1 Tax=Desulfotalea psychrophila (strain LSv54 / DSM 12343) TaxID=177439 RepID=Q6AMT3_DESPS|nr:S4 domain-containing protein [Desulfotalea psychrophila]CAG36342.1 probable heat shock protein Hsp15 [Desulfotalea psychrophila LSv54]